MTIQLDLAAPSGRDTITAPDDDRRGYGLRQQVYQRIDGDPERLYDAADAIGVPSYWLSTYCRGDADPPSRAVAGRLYRWATGAEVDADGTEVETVKHDAEAMYQRMEDVMEGER